MYQHAQNLEFELAAQKRDEIEQLRKQFITNNDLTSANPLFLTQKCISEKTRVRVFQTKKQPVGNVLLAYVCEHKVH